MIRKLSITLALTLMVALIGLIFQGWRLAGLDLLPIHLPFC